MSVTLERLKKGRYPSYMVWFSNLSELPDAIGRLLEATRGARGHVKYFAPRGRSPGLLGVQTGGDWGVLVALGLRHAMEDNNYPGGHKEALTALFEAHLKVEP